MTKFLIRCALGAALLAILGTPALAQTVTGTIQGTVTDTSGGVLPGVTVTLRHMDTGAQRTVVTNEAGIYSAPFVQIGRYAVAATMTGFGAITREDITVGLNETRVVDFKLDPRVTDTVTVKGEPPPINLTKAEVKSSLTEQQIMDKPSLNANGFLSLAETFPGFQENPTSGQNNPTASSGSSINFNNTGTRSATFQINGVNNDDSSENQNRQGVALSTIAEFQILKNGYSAEFGRGDGAVVLVQTKSGTNSFHGDTYLYRRENDWAARSWFQGQLTTLPPKAAGGRNQYGATGGFPIIRNKMFAYGSADYAKEGGEGAYTRDFPLPAEINGPWLTRGNDTPANRAWIQGILARFPSSLTNNDPRSTRTFTGVRDLDFPDYDYTGRLDWNLPKTQSLTSRYQWTHQVRETEEVINGENALQDHQQQNLGLTWTHMFNNSIVGEARYGLGLRSTNVDIQAGNDTPIVRFTGTPVSGAIIGNAGNFPINRDQTDHQFVYNLTAQLFTSHSFRTGVDLRRQALDDVADNFSRGFWDFRTTACAGTTYATPYAAFFDGCVFQFQKGYGPFFLENRMSESNLYLQDDWRLSDSVTLNLGVRYEYVAAAEEKEDRIDYIFGSDKNNIEPRIGIAYAPTWESGFLRKIGGGPGQIAFHAGYGIYDGRIFQSVFSQGGANVRFNPPNAMFSTLNSQLNVSDPTNGFVFTPGVQTARTTVTLPDPDLEVPSTSKWNLSVERIMPWNSTLKVTYQGNHNDKRLKYALDNLPLSPLDGPVTVVNHPFNAPAAGFPDLRGKVINAVAADFACAGTGLPGITTNAACPVNVPLADNEISQRVPRTNERRPNPLYTTNLLISNDAEAWYDGVEFAWDKRFSRGLQFQVSYTYSNSEDTTSEATFVGAGDSNQQGPNDKYSRAKSRFHTPHRFTFNGSYRLPFFADERGFLGQALGGWMIAGVVRLASGTPFTVTAPAVDLEFDGFSESRPVLLDPSVLGAHVDHRDTSRETLPVTAFRPVRYGDSVEDLVPRNSFYGDGLERVDLALSKVFQMPWSAHSLDFRFEAFNVLNHVQFGFPTVDVTSATFASITGVATSYTPRTLQLVLRYRY